MERFNFHCKDLDLSQKKKTDLLLSSLDSETFEKLKIHISLLSFTEITFEQIENALIKLYDIPTNYRTETFHFHTQVQIMVKQCRITYTV